MLSLRKQDLLKIIVGEYVTNANPVASDVIARKHGLPVSPATVRNEVATLEEEGYISRPHSSAGSVPLDKGYRYYVRLLNDPIELPFTVRVRLRQRFRQAEPDPEVWARLAAKTLAGLSNNMGVASIPRSTASSFRHLELVVLQEYLAMLIVVLRQATVRKELITFKEAVDAEELPNAINKLNDNFSGLTRGQMMARQVELNPIERQVLEAALRIMQDEEDNASAECFVDGLRHLLIQPEFGDASRTREFLALLEDRQVTRAILAQASGVGVVQVAIGGENPADELKPFSVIVTRYGVPDEATGTIGVLGPTRMQYLTAIGGVRYLSSLLSEISEEVFGNNN
jgi:heat-inducible transcriptional repressor